MVIVTKCLATACRKEVKTALQEAAELAETRGLEMAKWPPGEATDTMAGGTNGMNVLADARRGWPATLETIALQCVRNGWKQAAEDGQEIVDCF